MATDPKQQLRAEFDLPPATAAWVVATHIFVLGSPLLMIWAVMNYAPQLPTPFASPLLVIIASTVYIGATAFEVAQNSADRWYLTEATRSVADLFFNGFMTVAFCLYTIGFVGFGWAAIVTGLLSVIYPFSYIRNHPAHRGINGAAVLIATGTLYQVTQDPTVFLFLVGTGAGVFFISFLISRHAQWLHGLGAVVFGLAFLAWPWAIVNAANGSQLTWPTVGIGTAVIATMLAALAPSLRKLRATPRRYS